ncbi:MAG: hypothetical protein ACYTFH_06890 [Planctomycetota bacterium]|jgi:hypothetical protein
MQNPADTPNPAATAARRMTLYAVVLIVLGVIGYGLAWSEVGADATTGATDADGMVDGMQDGAEQGGAETAGQGGAEVAAAPSLTPLIFTIGPAVLMLLMAWMSRMIERSKPLGMIGIHLGMVLPVVFGIAYATVGWGRFTAWQAGEKPFANVVLFVAMVLASLIATIGILKARPSKDARGA